MSWTNIPDDALAVDKPIRSVDHLALRDNPIAIAQRATGAPVVQVPQRVFFLITGGHVWNVPANVSAFRVIAQGGGASVGLGLGSNGEDTIVTYAGVTLTAGGGFGVDGGNPAVTDGGVAVNGDINIHGKAGVSALPTIALGGDSQMGKGAVTSTGTSGFRPASGFGSGGVSKGAVGGGGGWLERRFISVGGSVTITVGDAGPMSGSGEAGKPGIVIIEY